MKRSKFLQAAVALTVASVAVGCSSQTDTPTGGDTQDVTADKPLSLAFTCKTKPKTIEHPTDASRNVVYEEREFYFKLTDILSEEKISFADPTTSEEEDDGRVIFVKGYDQLGEYNCSDDESGLACNIETLNENWGISRSPRRIVVNGDGDGCEWSELKLGVPKAAGDAVTGKLYWEGTTNCFGDDLFPKKSDFDVACTTEALELSAEPEGGKS